MGSSNNLNNSQHSQHDHTLADNSSGKSNYSWIKSLNYRNNVTKRVSDYDLLNQVDWSKNFQEGKSKIFRLFRY